MNDLADWHLIIVLCRYSHNLIPLFTSTPKQATERYLLSFYRHVLFVRLSRTKPSRCAHKTVCLNKSNNCHTYFRVCQPKLVTKQLIIFIASWPHLWLSINHLSSFRMRVSSSSLALSQKEFVFFVLEIRMQGFFLQVDWKRFVFFKLFQDKIKLQR